jgi:hypothetical protein
MYTTIQASFPPLLQHDLERLTARGIRWALVRTAPDDGWCGDYVIDGVPHFKAILFPETLWIEESKGDRKNKKHLVAVDTGNFHIYCCGNDDLYREIWGVRPELSRPKDLSLFFLQNPVY